MSYRQVALGVLVLITSSGLGYWSGWAPSQFRHFFNIGKPQTKIYLKEPHLLPQDIKNRIEHLTQNDLIITEDKGSYDVALVSWKESLSLPSQDIKWTASLREKVVAADFLTQPILHSAFIPLFWNQQKNEIIMYGFLNNSQSKLFLHELLFQNSVLKDWCLLLQLPNSLQALEASDLPENLKPSWVRKVDLN